MSGCRSDNLLLTRAKEDPWVVTPSRRHPIHATWSQFLDVWRAADEIDVFESAWNWDHFYP